MVEVFAPASDTPGGEALLSQLATFDEMYPDIRVDMQAKGVSGRGSTLDYLRTAPPVAPSVLPDLVLLNHNALVLAAREGRIVPWEEVSDEAFLALLDELYPITTDLGRVDGLLVGLPYMLEVRHAVFRESLFEEEPPGIYEDFLIEDSEAPAYVFPAAQANGVNRTTLLQYMAAGGRLIDDEGNPIVDAAALAEVLTFYEAARDAGVLDPSVLQYDTPTDAWNLYLGDEIGFAEVSSVPYLAGRAEARNTELAGVLTEEGNPITLVTGWSWALTTGDPERQAAAATLVAWLMEPVNHGTYAEAADYLPSQPGALAVWGGDDPYVPFINDLMEVAVLPPDPEIDSVVGVAMQEAVQDILLGRVSAQEAAAQAAADVAEAQDS
jgi:ABC-type glycerol-3-phosphate transport system substrate-binding protein